MPTRSEDFAGLTVAAITPFRNGQVDFEALQRQVEFQVQAGTTCVCPAGTTGESPTLSFPEHERVISAVVEAAAGRIKVMAGTGSNSTDEALELTRYAARAGADAALIVTPYYNRPTQEGIYQHFKVLAQAVEIPICVYNIPGRTGRNIEPETIIRMAELPNVTMLKESTGSLDQASQIIGDTDLTVLSGDDSLTLPLLAVGARGVVSVVGNIVPRGRDCDAARPSSRATWPRLSAGTTSSSRSAATCSGCRPIRSPSRRRWNCWAATRANCGSPSGRSAPPSGRSCGQRWSATGCWRSRLCCSITSQRALC